VTADQRRSAALLLWPERPNDLGEANLAAAGAAFHRSRFPLPLRLAQGLAARGGWLGWDSQVVEPLMDARRTALGEAARGAPRVLVRVDEFPHARAYESTGPFGTDRFRRFHSTLAEAGVPYLLAITPRVSRDYLDPDATESRPLEDAEVELLRELQGEGVTFGLHGLDHRSRRASPRRRSELGGLGLAAAAERIDRARGTFDALGIETPVFVPPFNRFDPAQYDLLAGRFEVVCGGPESVRLLGFSRTPAWRRDAVYLPSYPPLYGRASEIAAGVANLAAREAALWSPATLHWGWELEDGLADLRLLCETLRGQASSWSVFLDAVKKSRTAA
jgi:peptidoglycan/xylan/chitin deacetylase (PgdA/CDA1 family)